MMRVLFVCLGNICRSPMAEGLFKKMINDQGLDDCIEVESRATSTYEIGRPPHPRTQAILSREGASLFDKRAKQISSNDFDSFDLIIGMDRKNIFDLKQMTNKHLNKIYLFRDIDPNALGQDVPDPYYSGRYEETFELISKTLPLWLEKLKKS